MLQVGEPKKKTKISQDPIKTEEDEDKLYYKNEQGTIK